jgi:hypothetical protein
MARALETEPDKSDGEVSETLGGKQPDDESSNGGNGGNTHEHESHGHLDAGDGARSNRATGDRGNDRLASGAAGEHNISDRLGGEFTGEDNRNSCSMEERQQAAFEKVSSSKADRELAAAAIANGGAREGKGTGERAGKAWEVACDIITGDKSITREMDQGSHSALVAARDLCRNYDELLDFNANCVAEGGSPQGADKFYHCKGHCEAVQRGPQGEAVSAIAGEGREVAQFGWDLGKHVAEKGLKGSTQKAKELYTKEWVPDRMANQKGAEAGARGERCWEACNPRQRECRQVHK